MITKVGHILGHLLIFLGISELVPVVVAISYGETELIFPFFISSMFTIFVGLGFYFAFHEEGEMPSRYDVISLLVFSWFLIPVFASLPFMISGELTKFTDAYFEATSAFTTSGGTILANTSLSPKTILFWRSFLQWQGGIYIFILAASIVPLSAIGGSDLFRSALPHGEGEGLLARIYSSFKPLGQIYALFTFVCMILLSLSGMGSFDAMSTAMATVSSGGFTNHANSGVNSFNNITEFILVPFMILAATNLTYHWSFLSQGRYKIYKSDKEIKFFLMMLVFATVAIYAAIANMDHGSDFGFFKKIGLSIFTAVSALSTTGYIPDAASSLPLGVIITCIMLMFVGGTACSSAGGFKVLRLRVLFRQADSEISRLAHPHGIVAMRMNDMSVNTPILMSIWTLLFLYLSTIALVAILFAGFGYDLATGIGLTIANLFSAGSMTNLLASDFTGYISMTLPAKWLASFTMILGRLEIIALLIFLTPSFRNN
jgi:trk system potassium uptake protein TrkH